MKHASPSETTFSGRTSDFAMKPATTVFVNGSRRYSVICSGRWRSQWTEALSGARSGCRPMAYTRGSQGGAPARSQAVPRAAIALSSGYRCVSSAAGPPTGGCLRVRPAASWCRDQHWECLFRGATGTLMNVSMTSATSQPETATPAGSWSSVSGRSTLNGHAAALQAAQRSFESAGDRPVPDFVCSEPLPRSGHSAVG